MDDEGCDLLCLDLPRAEAIRRAARESCPRAEKETPYAAAIVGTTVAEAPLPELSLLPEPPFSAKPLLPAEPSGLSELPEPSVLSESPFVVRAGSMIVAYSAGLKRS